MHEQRFDVDAMNGFDFRSTVQEIDLPFAGFVAIGIVFRLPELKMSCFQQFQEHGFRMLVKVGVSRHIKLADPAADFVHPEVNGQLDVFRVVGMPVDQLVEHQFLLRFPADDTLIPVDLFDDLRMRRQLVHDVHPASGSDVPALGDDELSRVQIRIAFEVINTQPVLPRNPDDFGKDVGVSVLRVGGESPAGIIERSLDQAGFDAESRPDEAGCTS